MEEFRIRKTGESVIIRYFVNDNIIDERKYTVNEILRYDEYEDASNIIDNIIFNSIVLSKAEECNEHAAFTLMSKIKLHIFIQILKENPEMIESDMDYSVLDNSNILNSSIQTGFLTYNNPENTLSNSFILKSEITPSLMEKKIVLNNTTDYYDIELPRFEYQYAHSLKRILTKGIECENRTGINTLAVQHQYFYFKDITNNFPILRGKKVYPKMAFKEMIWMLSGRNDLKWLNDRKVTYWNEWGINDIDSAEKFNLGAEWIGTIGKSYGYQYRNFNGFDQVKALINNMKKDPMGRRHIINLWNSSELNQMALPPCMYDFHFECVPTERQDKSIYYNVDLHAHVRSNDSFLGAPYDFMFCGFMLTLICNYLNVSDSNSDGGKYYKPNDIHYTADNYHLYVNHVEAANQYLANVEENKSNIINIPSVIKTNFLEDFYQHYGKVSFDEYLDILDANIPNINIQLQTNETIEEYGPIKATIAI